MNKKMSDSLHNQEWSTWTTLSKAVNRFKFGWPVIDKLRPEHDLKWTRLCDLLLTGSRWWRHIWSKCKDYRLLRGAKFRIVSENFQKDHFVTVKLAPAALALTRFAADSFPVMIWRPDGTTFIEIWGLLDSVVSAKMTSKSAIYVMRKRWWVHLSPIFGVEE